jgi:hypothetical protein
MNAEKFELHAIVELFGHQRIAGKVSEQSIGVATFIRVDVKETDTQPAYTRLLNPSAIYAINPVTEEVATLTAQRLQTKPIDAWDIRDMQEKLMLTVAKNKKQEILPDDDNEEEDLFPPDQD